MKKVLGVLIGTAILFVLPGLAYSADMVADFDSGSDPVNWGGTTFAFSHEGADHNIEYTDVVKFSPYGYSLRFDWSGVDVAEEYAAGGVVGLAGADISGFGEFSFWIYTPNEGTDIGIELKFETGGDSRIKLTDYLTTGTSIWQQVSIPMAAIERANPNVDTTGLNEIMFSATYDTNNDAEGTIYIDNLMFTNQPHSPAGSLIFSGGDLGVADAADMPGDTLLWWDQATSSMTTNIVVSTVAPAYAISWADTPAGTDNVAPGDTVYYAFQILNEGNTADVISFSTEATAGASWASKIYWDRNKDGLYDEGVDIEHWDSIGTIPGTTHYFLLEVTIPEEAVQGSTMTIRVTAESSGLNDGWMGKEDTITHDIEITVLAPVISITKAASTDYAQPGSTITYTITYGNAGGDAATNVQIVDVIPFNTVLYEAVPAGDYDDVEYWYGSQWNGGFDVAAEKIRWTRNELPAATPGQEVTFTVEVK